MQNNSIPPQHSNIKLYYTLPFAKEIFIQTGLRHSRDTTVLGIFRKCANKDLSMVALYEKDWREGYSKRASLREELACVINRLSPSDKQEFKAHAYKVNIPIWEETERKINKLFIDWHFNKNYFDGKPLANSASAK